MNNTKNYRLIPNEVIENVLCNIKVPHTGNMKTLEKHFEELAASLYARQFGDIVDDDQLINNADL